MDGPDTAESNGVRLTWQRAQEWGVWALCKCPGDTAAIATERYPKTTSSATMARRLRCWNQRSIRLHYKQCTGFQ
jgi:hypothetical protein